MMKFSNDAIDNLIDVMTEEFGDSFLEPKLITNDIILRCKYTNELRSLEGFKLDYDSTWTGHTHLGYSLFTQIMTFTSLSGIITKIKLYDVKEDCRCGQLDKEISIYESESDIPDNLNTRLCPKCKSRDSFIEQDFELDKGNAIFENFKIEVTYCTSCGCIRYKTFK